MKSSSGWEEQWIREMLGSRDGPTSEIFRKLEKEPKRRNKMIKDNMDPKNFYEWDLPSDTIIYNCSDCGLPVAYGKTCQVAASFHDPTCDHCMRDLYAHMRDLHMTPEEKAEEI